MIENESNLKGIDKGTAMRDVLRLIDDFGYNCNVKLLFAYHYGTAQKRERIFFMASKKGTPLIETPSETNSLIGDMYSKPFNTIGNALKDLPSATLLK